MNHNSAPQVHTIEPFIRPDSRVLILGSFPSVQTRASGFFYGHPQNRFWRMMAEIFNEPAPLDTHEKMLLLEAHHLAVWDVIGSCRITGSSDASIRNATVNPIKVLVQGTGIRMVLVNGSLAGKLYQQHADKMPTLPFRILPSTSPANAAWSLDRLVSVWKEAMM